MINYIKADFYRIFRRKNIYISFMVLILIIPLIMFGAAKSYGVKTVINVINPIFYVIFFFISLSVNDYCLREDISLGILKNDMTTGVSRKKIYLSKFISGLILLLIFEILVYLLAYLGIGLASSFNESLPVIKNIFTTTNICFMFRIIGSFTLFQVGCLFATKTMQLFILCGIIDGVFMQILDSIKNIKFVKELITNETSDLWLNSLILCIISIILLYIGTKLFQKKSL